MNVLLSFDWRWTGDADSRRGENAYSEEYSAPSIVCVMKSKSVRWPDYVAYLGLLKNT
jgi:hypothetical protein